MRAWIGIAVLAFSGCRGEDIVIVDPLGCATSFDCKNREFCAKPSCEAATGRCEPTEDDHPCLGFPDVENGQLGVCGCNGVTYWNDCLRRHSGVAASVKGQCAQPATCGGDAGVECPDVNAVCAQLTTGCSTAVAGRCWVVPRTCPPAPPGAPGRRSCSTLACTDECRAIASGELHEMSISCP